MSSNWLSRRRPERQILCRHCFVPFKRSGIGIRCESGACREVPDEQDRRGPRFFFAEGRKEFWCDEELNLGSECPFCRQVDFLRSVCPHCRKPLDLDLGEDHVIAVIGASAAGKTHFLATLLHQLLDARVGESTWEISLDERRLRPFRRKLLDPLFEGREVLESTADRLAGELALPLTHREDGRRILLVFRDLGGEIFRQPERLQRVSFLRYAQGVVLMADPLVLSPALARRVGWDPDGHQNAQEVLEVYRQVLDRQERRVEHRALPLLPEEKVLAVTVTKADLVLEPAHPFWVEEEGTPYLARGYWKDRKAESKAVEAWIREHLSTSLPREAGLFAAVGYFFVSSFGYPQPPEARRLPHPPRPRRVHEPIFALLDALADRLPSARSEWAPSEEGRKPAERREQDRRSEPAAKQRPGSEDWGEEF